MIKNGRANMADMQNNMKKLHIGGTILIKNKLQATFSTYSNVFLKAHGLFSLDYII